ncbi:MAG: hypothetical protein LBH43_15570 [Treponema sp.]|jgi:hypothetical protein|nr:hypothetical protein [Treponema sp.]
MTYFEAIEIKQDLIVNMQYADIFHKTTHDAFIETAKKYSVEQYQEAFKVICAKLKEEKEDLRKLFTLAIKGLQLNENKGENSGKI